MPDPTHEIIQARIRRRVATLRLMAQIAFGTNLAFLILALAGNIWLRVILLSVAQIGFALTIFLAAPRYFGVRSQLNTGKTVSSDLDRHDFSWLTPWLFLFSCWMAIINGIYTNGAPSDHIILAWLVVLICIAGFMGSFIYSGVTALVSAASIISVWFCQLLGIEAPNLTPPTQQTALAAMHTFALVTSTALLVVAYQRKIGHYELQVEQILKRLEEEAQQREAAEAAVMTTLNEKQQLMRNLSHEFRTPLNSIIGFSERILKQPGIDQWRKPIEAIARNGHALHRLVGESLLLDAIEATPLEVQRSNVEQILENIIEAQELLITEHGLTLSYTGPDNDAYIYADIDIARLAQALTNVLLFCVRQTPQNSKNIEISLNAQSSGIEMSFYYGDKTLSEEAHQQLFETHYEHVLNNDKDIPISAFALKIAGVIITCHQGSYRSVTSENGERNKIIVTLPLSELG